MNSLTTLKRPDIFASGLYPSIQSVISPFQKKMIFDFFQGSKDTVFAFFDRLFVNRFTVSRKDLNQNYLYKKSSEIS